MAAPKRNISIVVRLSTCWVAVMACFFAAKAQPSTDAPNRTDAQGRKQGLWIKTHPETGKPAYRATFINDVPQDTTLRYYEDGSLQAEVIHRRDGVDVARLYYPDGTVLATGHYINRERDSTWHFYSTEGILTAEENYRLGKKNGIARTYYPDGSISEKAHFTDGVKDGKWEQYYPNGNLRLSATVSDGMAYEGEYIGNYENGRPEMKGRYENGMREGSWYHFHENGAVEVIYVYREGKVISEHPQNGTFDKYYNNDIMRSSHTYADGKLNGPFKEYYNQGEWRTEEATDEFGNTRPVQKLYGTQVMREGKYLEGQLHGEVITYTEKGKIDKKENYEHGIRIR